MGTGPFAVPTFAELCAGPDPIVGVVTRPDKPAIGKGPAPFNPVREMAQRHNLPIFDPASINSPAAHAQLLAWAADLFVVCDYGQILSAATLGLARLGGINLHGSLLPKYRGAAPIQWAIYHGDDVTGVTVIHMTPQLDAGPCLVQVSTPIDPRETNVQLEPRLAQLGVTAVKDAIEQLRGGQTRAVLQDPSLASPARRLSRADGRLDWSRSAIQLQNQIRAWQPWPKSFTHWLRGSRDQAGNAAGDSPPGNIPPPLRLIIEEAWEAPPAVAAELAHQYAECQNRGAVPPVVPGTILAAEEGKLMVQCGTGVLEIKILQPAGKKAMPAADFLRGQKVGMGERLGDAPA
ncbi:MAG: methionyl-tRNA formyltransferase [Pirellulales bacterium]|nr:methionyl-tRNA formyltransferase [Pirellulales bacterium]